MLEKGHYFPGQQRDEKIILFIRGHWLAFLPWILVDIVLIIGPLILMFVLGVNFRDAYFGANKAYWIVCTSAYFLTIIAFFLITWINFYLNVTIVTTDHLVDISQNGMFNRKISEQTLLRVQDVSARMRGVMQTFFRFGSVFVETAGEAPNFKMNNIYYPHRVANIILGLHEDLVQKSGGAKNEDTGRPMSDDTKRTVLKYESLVSRNSQPKENVNASEKFINENKIIDTPKKAVTEAVEIKVKKDKKNENKKEGELKEGEAIQL